jgi:outer membrane lipoprotein SlyB
MHCSRLVISALLAAGLAGCATQQPISSTEGTTMVRPASVTSVRDVTVNTNRNSGLGTIVGSVLGALIGSNIGSGTGSTVASVGGAVAGGVAGQQVGTSTATKTVTELGLRFDNGDTRTYNIEPGEAFRVGDRVKVTTHNGTTRITH